MSPTLGMGNGSDFTDDILAIVWSIHLSRCTTTATTEICFELLTIGIDSQSGLHIWGNVLGNLRDRPLRSISRCGYVSAEQWLDAIDSGYHWIAGEPLNPDAYPISIGPDCRSIGSTQLRHQACHRQGNMVFIQVYGKLF